MFYYWPECRAPWSPLLRGHHKDDKYLWTPINIAYYSPGPTVLSGLSCLSLSNNQDHGCSLQYPVKCSHLVIFKSRVFGRIIFKCQSRLVRGTRHLPFILQPCIFFWKKRGCSSLREAAPPHVIDIREPARPAETLTMLAPKCFSLGPLRLRLMALKVLFLHSIINQEGF